MKGRSIKGIRESYKEEDETGSRENRDPDWEGSDVSNRKHDPAVLRLYLASVAMCWERTLQTLTLPLHIHPGPLTGVSVDCPRHHLPMEQVCERTRVEHTCGGLHGCVMSSTSKPVCNIWIPVPVPCCGSSPRSSRAAHACCVEAAERTDRLCDVFSLFLSSWPLQPLFSSLKIPLLATGGRRALQRSAPRHTISPETGKKNFNMETRFSWTNERTAMSKPASLIGRLYCELIFRSHVTGVYRCRAKVSTNHLLFWFTHITKHLDINIH